MNIYSYIKNEIQKKTDISEDFSIETPKLESHGDVSINLAFILAKNTKKTPLVIANGLLPKIKELTFILNSEIAGLGFINIFLKPEFLYKAFQEAIKPTFGINKSLGNEEKINIEYCSANPTGPIHIGHTRGTIYGDILSELLSKNGFNVTREYYINDSGNQIETLIKSIFIRIRQILGEDVKIPEGCYPGEYLIPVANSVLNRFGKEIINTKYTNDVSIFVINLLMDQIKSDLLSIKVKHDVFTSERDVTGGSKVQDVIDILKDKDLVYTGILPKPKGKHKDDFEEKEQVIFKSKQFGDSEDRVLQKSDGSSAYFTHDITYHKNKLDRGFYKMVLVLGADHAGYIQRITSAVKAISDKPEKTDVIIKACQIVRFLKNGEVAKMSKRSGVFTCLSDIASEVNPDILRFILLTKKNDSHMDFDFEKVKEQTKENPIFYIQYAFSRGSSLLRNFKFSYLDANLLLLKEVEEISIIKMVLQYPKIIEMAVKKYEPHLIATFIYELSSKFHSFWNMGNENHSLRFISEDIELTKSRMFMVSAVLNVISSAFSIFKIDPMERM